MDTDAVLRTEVRRTSVVQATPYHTAPLKPATKISRRKQTYKYRRDFLHGYSGRTACTACTGCERTCQRRIGPVWTLCAPANNTDQRDKSLCLSLVCICLLCSCVPEPSSRPVVHAAVNVPTPAHLTSDPGITAAITVSITYLTNVG